ncbi:MAG: acyl-CoA reductase [bacterium]|nr:acyl-CoA reductase [bacterium]
MRIQSLFFEGKKEHTERELADVVRALEDSRAALHNIPVDEILDFFGVLSARIARLSHPAQKTGGNFGDLVHFLKKENLGKNLDLALRGKRAYLDGFIQPEGFDFFLHAQPRGLVVEWLAGNIPLLGIYSLAQVTATKNVLLTKAPKKNYEILLDMLEIAADAARGHKGWERIINSVSVIGVPKNDRAAHEELSRFADVRILWGGEESVKAILSLSKNFWTEDIVYGPKYSYALISKAVPQDRMRTIASALAVDVANFDQYACSSPHVVFIEAGGVATPEVFGQILAKELERTTRLLLPKGEMDAETVMQILTLRAEYASRGEVIIPQGNATDWTVIITNEEGFSPIVGSRTIFIKPIKSISDLASLNSHKIQTIGFVGAPEEDLQKIDDLTLKGGDRLPQLGNMSFFASPWDGLFAMDRLVRWVRYH